MAITATATQATKRTALTTNQKRAFLAAYGGWTLDGMDAFIYALVLVPALTELLPASGIAATPVTIGFWGSILFAMFLLGWGLSMVWGPIGDRIGRVRALMLTIVAYSPHAGSMADLAKSMIAKIDAGDARGAITASHSSPNTE